MSGRGATVSGFTQTAIASAIQSVCDGTNAGSVIFPSGTYSVTSSLVIPGNCTLQAESTGGAIISAAQNQIFTFNGDNITINGLVLDGGWMAFSNSTATYHNFTFTSNVVRNLTNSNANGGPPALTLSGIAGGTIANNSWSNIWGGGSPGYPNAPPVCIVTCDGTGIDSWGAAAIVGNIGQSQLVITNNTFDKIASDSIHLSWDIWLGNDNFQPNSSGNVISYNTFTHQRRIPIEIQSVASGCPGGCQYGGPSTLGMQIKGNYIHDYSFPYYDTWGSSLVPDFSQNNLYINNTFVANVTDGSSVNGWAPCMESSGDYLISQGNVCENVSGSANAFGSWFLQGSGYNSGFTNYYQNTIVCANPTSLNWSYDGQSSTYDPPVSTQYNYMNGSSCPAGTSLTTSKIVQGFVGANNQSFPGGGNGTWNSYVQSNLSIRYVQYFLDGASTPIVTQELQDLNSNFSNDLKWLYHATISTSALAPGSHTIAAVATDVSGATNTVTQAFSVGGTPSAVVTLSPSGISFGSFTVGQSASPLSVTLANAGNAALAISGMTIQGANASDFSLSSQCGTSLAANASCIISLGFQPSGTGSRTATLNIADSAAGSPQTVQLTGTGSAVVVSLTPGTYNLSEPNGNTMDAGWYVCCSDNNMHEYTYNNNVYQQFVISASGTICNVGTSLCLSDQGAGYVKQSGADKWAIVNSGSGYTIQDLTTQNYLNPALQIGEGSLVTTSGTPFAWTATLSSGSANPPSPSQPAPPSPQPPPTQPTPSPTPSGNTLAAGTYIMQDAFSNVLDAGWYWYGGGGTMHEYSYNGNPNQQFTLSSAGTLCDVGTGLCLADQNGTLIQGGSDTWTIVASGSGYTIQNNKTQRFLNNTSGQIGEGVPMALSSLQTVWNLH